MAITLTGNLVSIMGKPVEEIVNVTAKAPTLKPVWALINTSTGVIEKG